MVAAFGLKRWVKWMAVVVAAAVLLVGFLAYLRPDFIIDLGGQMFLCS